MFCPYCASSVYHSTWYITGVTVVEGTNEQLHTVIPGSEEHTTCGEERQVGSEV